MPTPTTVMGLLKALGIDNARDYIKTYLAQSLDAIDAHDHSVGKGVSVKRLDSGLLASRPAAGNPGHVYWATDTKHLWLDDGAAWVQLIAAGPDDQVFTGIARFLGGGNVSQGADGAIVIGDAANANLTVDSNDIQARNNGLPVTLNLNPSGGNVRTGGAIVVGDAANANLTVASNLLQARNNGLPVTLNLNNEGGDVLVNGAKIATAANSLAKLAEIVANGSSNVFDFTGIPATYRHLVIEFYARATSASFSIDNINLTFNNDGTNSYDYVYGDSESTVFDVPSILLGAIPAASFTAGRFAAGRIEIPHYANTAGHKLSHSWVTGFASNGAFIGIRPYAGLWKKTTAINRVTIRLASANFVSGSVATLYGLP